MAHWRTHLVFVARDDQRQFALVVRGLLFGQVYDLSFACVRLDRLDPLPGCHLGFIPLAGGDDLAVGGLEVQAVPLELETGLAATAVRRAAALRRSARLITRPLQAGRHHKDRQDDGHQEER